MPVPGRPAGSLRALAWSAVLFASFASGLTFVNAASSLRELSSPARLAGPTPVEPLSSGEAIAQWIQTERGLTYFLLFTELPYAVFSGAVAILAVLVLLNLRVHRWLAVLAAFAAVVRLGLGIATYLAIDGMLALRDQLRVGLPSQLGPEELERLAGDIQEMRGSTAATTFGWAAVVCGYFLALGVASARRQPTS